MTLKTSKPSKPASAMSRVDMETRVWKRTHPDYRGETDGVRGILVLRNGSTQAVALKDLTDQELIDRL